MIKNYFKIAIRNIFRNPVYSIINISGLSIGMACFLLLFLNINYEFSYDKYHENKNNIYRIVSESWIGTPAGLAPVIESEIPEITRAVRIDFFTNEVSQFFRYEDKKFNEHYFFLVDPSFFQVFTYRFLYGDPAIALSTPNSLVLTEQTAIKYFGEGNALGKILNYEGKKDFIVTGVIKDVPGNSHFHFDIVVPFENQAEFYGYDYVECWGCSNFITYILTTTQADPSDVLYKIGEIYKENNS